MLVCSSLAANLYRLINTVLATVHVIDGLLAVLERNRSL